MLDEMYTDQEVSHALKIGRSTLARWREQGLISFVKLPNGQVRYLQEHYDALRRYVRQGSGLPGQELLSLDSHNDRSC